MTESDAPPPKKRSFFKKAAWQTKVKGEDEKEKDMFSHSSEFRDILADEARRKQEEREKELARKEEERLRKEARRRAKEEEQQERKRRKVSEEGYTGISSGGSGHRKGGDTRSQTPLSPLPTKTNYDSLSSRYDTLTKSASQKPTHTIIDLGDSGSEPEDTKPLELRSKRTRDASAELEEIEDPYFAELAAKAHERRPTNSSTPIPNGAPPTPAIPEAVVVLLISSDIPDTEPLIIKIKTTSALSKPRRAWCSKQGFTESEAENVFLTWKKRKLTEFTTIARLGVKVGPEGIITIEGDSELYSNDDPPRIHLEAWTEELYSQMKAEVAAETEKMRRALEPPKPVEEEIVPEAPREVKTAVILKAQGQDDFKIWVKPVTTFEHLAHAYKEKNKIPKEQPITLMFDGDRLSPMDTVGDMDIEHMDAIEVHFK